MMDDRGDKNSFNLGSVGARNDRNDRQNPRSKEEIAATRPGEIDHMSRAKEYMAQYRARYGDLDQLGEITFDDKWNVEAPPGWTYEWKTFSVWNKEYPQYHNALLRSGWQAVPATRHRDKMVPGSTDESIIIDGLMLMERPQELTQQRRRSEYLKAVEIVRMSEARLADAPPGTAPRATHPEIRPRVSGHVGPVITD